MKGTHESAGKTKKLAGGKMGNVHLVSLGLDTRSRSAFYQDHEGLKVTALPLPRARGQLTGISGSTSQLFEWDGTRAQNRF